MTSPEKPLLHICYAPADHEWVHGRMLQELGLRVGQYRTRADDGLGELQLKEIARAVTECRFTVLIASSATRWDRLAQFAAAMAQHAGMEREAACLVIIARDFAPATDTERVQLPLDQRVLVGLDCSDESRTVEAMKRLRKVLGLDEPISAPPACPYPGLAHFTAANRALLFGRDSDRNAISQRIRARHTRILVVGPSGSGKSSLIHAAVLPALAPGTHLVQVVPPGGDLAAALRVTIDALEVPGLGGRFDDYLRAVRSATGDQFETARGRLRAEPAPDARRRVVVIDPLEPIFASDESSRATLFTLLAGLWSLPWCTVILCLRADFRANLMVEPCWSELESSEYELRPLDEAALRAAITGPAMQAGIHVEPGLVERLVRELDRDRSSAPLPLLQLALSELWTRLRWGYLTLDAYEQIVNGDQRGLSAVLAVHAESVVQSLTRPGDRAIAKRILLDLIQPGEGRPDTRRQRTFEELRRSGDPPGQLERVLETLVGGRLITSCAGERASPKGGMRQIDLAHDALITGWPELARWIGDHKRELIERPRLEPQGVSHKGGVEKHTILFLPANPSRTDPRALDREPRAIRAELEPESEPSSHPGEADRPTLRVPTGVDASRLVLITTEPSHAFQDQRLLEILRQLTPIIAPRETDRGTLFREIIEPAFGDLRGVHRDYVEIFRQMQRRIPARREDPQYQSRVRAAAEHLRDMRMKGAPVRVELRKLAEHLQREPLSAQVRAFAAAVLDYFPDGSLREPGQHRDARWWKTASSFLLDHIDEDLLAVKDHDLVGLVHDTVVTLETGWARACDAFHALRLAPFR